MSPLTASGRTDPASTNGTMPAIGLKKNWVSPAMVAVIAGPPPRNGTWTVSFWIPASAMNIATAKWLVDPGPPEA